MLAWQFPENQSNEEEGLANASIETFRSAPLSSLTRESSQNSIDAAAVQDKKHNQVRVVFQAMRVKKCEIPNINELTNALSACLKKAKKED